MFTAKKSLIVLFAAGLIAVAAAPHYRWTRPQALCGLPERDYQFRSFSQPETSLSRGPVLIPATVAAATGTAAAADRFRSTPVARRNQTIKSFQFVDKPTLRIDHCSISRMSVLLHGSGVWSVSLRADQNPLTEQAPERDVTTAEPARLITDHLRRNEFLVEIRCYATRGAARADGLLGKPLIIPLYVEPFWVQRQQPRHVFVSGCDPRIKDYFDVIDRVEIEFIYRTD